MPRLIAQMDNSDGTFESANRVYDKRDAAPTISTCGGGNLQPKVVRKLHFIVAERGRDNGQTYEIREDRVCNTITTVTKDNFYVGKINNEDKSKAGHKRWV